MPEQPYNVHDAMKKLSYWKNVKHFSSSNDYSLALQLSIVSNYKILTVNQ